MREAALARQFDVLLVTEAFEDMMVSRRITQQGKLLR